MPKNILWSTIFLAWLPLVVAGQTKVLSGHLSERGTGKAIAGATVQAGGQRTMTAANGSFSLAWLQGDSLRVSCTGFAPMALLPDTATGTLHISLIIANSVLEDVVVSGTLRPVRRAESAIPVESYSPAFFRQNPTPSMFDAVSMMNGVQSQLTCNVCNTGDLRINGMEGPYTMVLIDGMPIVSSLSTVYGLSGIPTSIIKRLEVVKGPASTLYGSEAVGGLINIITKDPTGRGGVNLDMNVTNLGELTADLGAQLKAGRATGLLGVSAYNYWTRHDINGDNFTDVAQQRRLSLFSKWELDRNSKLPASLAVRLLGETRWGGEMHWHPAYKGGDEVYAEHIATRRAELIGRYGIFRSLILEYSYNYHWQDSYYGTTWYKGQQHTSFAQLRWEKSLGRHNLLAGIPLRYLWYDDNTTATAKPAGNAPSRQTMMALYLQDEMKWNNQLTTLLGLRYEYTNLQGGIAAPRVALKWSPAEHHILRLSGGNGFRIVNLFTEDHAALSGFREIVIKNDLKPERSWNANLNYTGDVHLDGGVLGWDASAFFTRFTNKIIPDYDSDPQKIIYDNLDGHAVSKGLSASTTLTLRGGLRAMAAATFMEVFAVAQVPNGYTERTQQAYAPRWSGTYSLSYPWRRAGLSVDLTGKWFGPMRLPVVPSDFRPAYSPWYTLMNLQVTKKWGGRTETYIAVKNLFNFIPQNPILHPDDPFDRPGGLYWNADGTPNATTNPHGYTFDPTYNYAPMQGTRLMIGLRCQLGGE